MAIVIAYGVNMALQYNNANEIDMNDYIMNTARTGGLFLTETPNGRVINIEEKGGLYFLSDQTSLSSVAYYEFKDAFGNIVFTEAIALTGLEIHNSIPILSPNFAIPATADTLTIDFLSGGDLLLNGDFELGTGDDFDSWTESGPVTQTAAGGLFGTRGVVFSSGIFDPVPTITQGLAMNTGTTYRLSFYAKGISGSNSIQYTIGDTAYAPISIPNTADYVWYTFEFTTGLTITSNAITIGNESPLNGVVHFDRIQLIEVGAVKISEQRKYVIDRDCSDNPYQLEWLNKLGGRDTFYFKGNPIISKDVDRSTPIEFSKSSNFVSPKRIKGFRKHASEKEYELFHRCKNIETAVWLRDELIDSIDINILFGDYYYPVNVVENTVTIENTASKERIVRFKFRLAFDVNIQTR